MSRAPPASVLVTGATGFLGGHVCAALAARGVAVRGLIRREGAPLPAGTIPAPARGLDDIGAIREAVRGVEAVVHLAARVHQHSEPDDTAARAVNVEGTRRLMEEAIAAGVRDFVFASSVKAVGERADTPWNESTPPAPVDPYGRTKLEAEGIVRELATRHGIHAPVLRLPLVYGPDMKGNALRLFHLVDREWPLPLGLVRNRRSLLFTGNLVAALVATLESAAANDTFFVSDAESPSTPELVKAIARALGRRPRLVAVPVGLLRAAGRAGDLAARVLPVPYTSEAVGRLTDSLVVDSSHLSRSTGYAPPYSMTQGLEIAAEWYRRRFATI